MTTDTLVSDTRSKVARWDGWRIERILREPSGWQYGFAATAHGQTVLCVCKRELFDNLASVMQRLVEHDAVRHTPGALVEFVGEAPTYDSAFAFDPNTVLENGVLNTGPSAKGVDTTWYELDCTEWGTRLGRWLFENEPLVPPGGLVDGQATLEVGP